MSLEADVLIVGGGSAGCVLAARLSEDAGCRVILIEAGRDVSSSDVPADIASGYPGRAFLNPAYKWADLRARLGMSRANAAEARLPRLYEQAKVLGGGSCINAMVANRGAPDDYNEWHDLGATGWGWHDVLPYFRKLETDCDLDGGFHGQSGPIHIRRHRDEKISPFVKQVRSALVKRGHSLHNDQNGVWEDGVFAVTVACAADGGRQPTSLAYLTDDVRKRPNLRIVTGVEVTRILFDGLRAIGVEVRTPGGTMAIRASQTIVCCGGVHSPALLMRSGIGPAAHLRDIGVEVVADSVDVGQNLMEHPSLSLSTYLAPQDRVTDDSTHQAQACLRLSSGLEAAGVGDLHFQILAKSAWHAIGRRLGTLFFWINKPYSRGEVRLRSADPAARPDVDFRLLSDRRDLERMKQCVRVAASVLDDLYRERVTGEPFPAVFSDRIKKVSAVNAYNAARLAAFGMLLDLVGETMRAALIRTVVTEGLALRDLLADDDALEAFVLKSTGGTWHPTGTCRMGAIDDIKAVTDASGRVRGVMGLRVCDGSLMPSIPRANTNIPIIMMAERIADLVKAEAK
ncbi:MAG TPA: GMC family oxidoreductase N-terminal domain-containing protein [Pseudolabrys sp.]|nr:GMC family oxidoreductase N-terminal domain-containing protein [Pseudolabrys sp.]